MNEIVRIFYDVKLNPDQFSSKTCIMYNNLKIIPNNGDKIIHEGKLFKVVEITHTLAEKNHVIDIETILQ